MKMPQILIQKVSMPVLAGILLASQALTSSVAFAQTLTSENIKKTASDAKTKVIDKVKSTPVRIDKHLIGTSLFDVLNLGMGAGFSLTPTNDRKSYSRSERIRLQVGIGKSLDLPGPLSLSVGLDRGSEVEFIRQFETQLEALNLVKHPPLGVLHIPFNSERALAMQEGDYTKYVSRLATTISPGLAVSQGLVSANASLGYVVYGDFQVEVYRKPNNKILFRASALKQETIRASLSANLNYGLKIFSIEALDGGIRNRLMPTQFFSLGVANTNGDVFIIEYEYDLNYPEARQAYDNLINPDNWLFHEVRISNPLKQADSVLKLLLSDVIETETLAQKDESLALGSRRVVRVNKGRSEFKNAMDSLSIDFKLMGVGGNNNFLVQDFTFQDSKNQWHKLRLGTYAETTNLQFGFGLLRDNTLREADVLFQLDQNNKIKNFVELGFSIQKDDRLEFNFEREDIKHSIRRMLPEELHGLAEVDSANQSRNKDARISVTMVTHRPLFGALEMLDPSQVLASIDKLIARVSDSQYGSGKNSGYYGQLTPSLTSGKSNRSIWTNGFAYDIRQIRESLPQILSPKNKLTADEKWELFADLRKNELFNKIGAGILTRLYFDNKAFLISQGFNPEDVMSFNILIAARDTDKIEVSYGNRERAEAFRNLVTLKNRILNRNFDPEYFK